MTDWRSTEREQTAERREESILRSQISHPHWSSHGVVEFTSKCGAILLSNNISTSQTCFMETNKYLSGAPRCLDKQDRTQASDLVSFTETDGILVRNLVVDLFLEEVEVCGSSEAWRALMNQKFAL